MTPDSRRGEYISIQGAEIDAPVQNHSGNRFDLRQGQRLNPEQSTGGNTRPATRISLNCSPLLSIKCPAIQNDSSLAFHSSTRLHWLVWIHGGINCLQM